MSFSLNRDAGDGDLEVFLIHEETGLEVPVRVIDNDDNTYLVEVIPPQIGTYSTHIKYGGKDIPAQPKVHVTPAVDVSKVKVDGLEQSK